MNDCDWMKLKGELIEPRYPPPTNSELLAFLKDGIDSDDQGVIDIANDLVASYKRRRPLTYNLILRRMREDGIFVRDEEGQAQEVKGDEEVKGQEEVM